MKGKLVKLNGDWAIRFFDSVNSTTIPLHPLDMKYPSLLNEGSDVEFDIHDEENFEGPNRFARILIQHNF
jgi:hypothetical protein